MLGPFFLRGSSCIQLVEGIAYFDSVSYCAEAALGKRLGLVVSMR